ncbi:hypothetical protein QAD02_005992 [Eretmocerus hayati]|uniref:Uncharacterized protein n=1 Tax=Eretmocerus hayati TaxID=131215 RepID=A0ACC2MZV1_9HYME|nr:hypothetical protein QAD02_005992 [Eretmocerus hayati]
MDDISRSKESPKKITEPLITIPKPRPYMINVQQQKNLNNASMKLTNGMSKYAELLDVIEELGQHLRPSYAGHRGSAEKMRQGVIRARVLVKECLIETEKSARN